MTAVTPKGKPLRLRLPKLPEPAAEREQVLRAIAEALVATLTPATALALAATIDEVAQEAETGRW